MKILIADDEESIIEVVKIYLEKEGYSVLTALDGDTALKLEIAEKPDLLILDIMLPKMSGLELCRAIEREVPIIFLTAKTSEEDKIAGFALGADDYITKPFSVRELIARVKANLRRTAMPTENNNQNGKKNTIMAKNLIIDLLKYEATKDGEVLPLTVREFELLKYLATQKDQVFSREQLLESVWGYEYYGDMRTVDVTVRRLREKVEDDSANPEFIVTRRGVGYYFKG